MLAFIIWALVGVIFVFYGIYAACSKKEVPFGFWANAKMFPVRDVKAYNRALGKLFTVYGIVFILLGLPLPGGQNSPYIIIPILGILIESITAMAVYVTVIEQKYRK